MRTVFDRPPVLAFWITLAFAAGLVLRVLPGHSTVFPTVGEPHVEFREIDPWYHLRAIEFQVANFPARFRHDPYLGFPAGGDVPVAPLLDWLAAAAVLVASAGPPNASSVETVAAWLPAILGALLALPAALLARRLGGGLAAALAALIAVLGPGQFLARSLLGFVDHHVLEVLLSTAFLAALAGALEPSRPARARTLSALLAGLALCGLFLAWVGTAVLILVFLVWVVLEFAFDLVARRPLDWLGRAVVPALALASAGVALFYDGVTVPRRNLLAVLAALAVAGGLALAAGFGARASSPRAGARRTALCAAGGGVVALGLVVWLAPGAFSFVLSEVTHFAAPGDFTTTVFEAAPLSSLGSWWRVLWSELSVPGFVALAGLAVGLVRWVAPGTHPTRPESLLLFWSAGLVGLTVHQNRFLYYLVLPAAVGTAVMIARLAARLLPESTAPRSPGERVARILLFAGTLTLVTGLGLPAAVQRSAAPSAMSSDWREALLWLRASTPEPFGDPMVYWRGLPPAAAPPPRAGYSVAAWWDYGYWILRLGHRVPAADPTQRGAREMARLLMAADDPTAEAIMNAIGARYLILDSQLPMLLRGGSPRPAGKFRSLALWAEEPERRHVEEVVRRDAAGELRPVTLFYPDYYRTLLVRLYLYGGRAHEPRGPAYVAELAPNLQGGARELLRLETLASHAAALAYLAGRDPERFLLVGLDPAISCTPLRPTSLLREVHASPTAAALRGARPIAEVEIFERRAAETAGATVGSAGVAP